MAVEPRAVAVTPWMVREVKVVREAKFLEVVKVVVV